MKMKRRNFLKMVGLAVACPTQLLKSKPPLTHPVDVLLNLGMPNGKLLRKMRKYCSEPFYTGGIIKLTNKAILLKPPEFILTKQQTRCIKDLIF